MYSICNNKVLFPDEIKGKDEFLGSCSVLPAVRTTQDITALPPLDWYGITRYNKSAGEVLIAFELLLDEGAPLTLGHLTKATSDDYYIVPEGIRPRLKQTIIEVILDLVHRNIIYYGTYVT